MPVADSADQPGEIWPEETPPGQWRLTPAGADSWRRFGINGQSYELPVGRGPGRFDMAGTRWWPEHFAFDPYDTNEPPRAFDTAPTITEGGDGWPAYALPASLRAFEAHPIAPLPRGAARFASGGWPVRLVALVPTSGELWWWDPAERRWLSLGLAVDDPEAMLFGCDDGVLLLANGQLVWIIADHANAPTAVAAASVGRPLTNPVQLGRQILWPALVDHQIRLWRLCLPKRTRNLADPARYTETLPQPVPIAGRNPAQGPVTGIGIPVRQSHASAWLLAADGALSLRQHDDDRVAAHWHPHPAGYRGFWKRPLHLRSDTGAIEAQLENGDHVATMVLGNPHTLQPQPMGLAATLGGQCWQGRTAIGGGHGWQADVPVAGTAGTWLLPVAAVQDGVLMVEFPDITNRDRLLRGEPCGVQLVSLLTVAGGIAQSLNAAFRVRSVDALAVAAHPDGLLIINREDSRQCVVLGRL